MKRRYTSRQAIEKIRKWVNKKTNCESDNSAESDTETDGGQQGVPNPDIDSGSEDEDCITEDNSHNGKSSSDVELSELDVASDDDSLSGDENCASSVQYKCKSGLIWKLTVPPSSKIRQVQGHLIQWARWAQAQGPQPPGGPPSS